MEDIYGAYYLHENGSMIWKSKACFYGTTPQEYFDSPFVKRYWLLPEKFSNKFSVVDILDWFVEFIRDAYRSGAKEDDLIKICEGVLDEDYLRKNVFFHVQ